MAIRSTFSLRQKGLYKMEQSIAELLTESNLKKIVSRKIYRRITTMAEAVLLLGDETE